MARVRRGRVLIFFGLLAASGCGGGSESTGANEETSDAAPAPSTVGPTSGSAVGSTDGSAGTGASGDGSVAGPTTSSADSGAASNPAADGAAPATGGATPHADGGPPAGGGAGPDASSTTGKIDAAAGSPVPGTDAGTAAGSACVSSLPAGWSLTAFNTGIDPCPANFTEHVAFGPPNIAAGACSCGCSVTQPGSCGQGALAMSTNPGHHNDACTMAWFTATVNGSECIPVPAAAQGTLGNFEATPLPASAQGGTCAETVQTNAGLLSEPTQRFCDVPAASADTVCNGSAPADFSACITAPGNVACPSSTPFIHGFTIEDSAALTCGACGACSVATTCGSPTLLAFTDANCTAPAALSFAVDGTCVGNPAEQTVLSIQYSAAATDACTAGASAGSATLTGARTICCR